MRRAVYLLFMLRECMIVIVLMNCPGPVYIVGFFILQCSYSISLSASYLNSGVLYNS